MSTLFGHAPQQEGAKREKVEFPLSTAVDNVQLRNVEINPNIEGITFNFQRVEGETIAFLSDTLLPPKKEWFTEDKKVGDKTITAEEQYDAAVRSFIGYVRHLLVAAGVTDDDLQKAGQHETVSSYIKSLIDVVNPVITAHKNLMYLKTVKDKAGYTKLPKFRGTGVAQNMVSGKPNFEYSNYELQLMAETTQEGVVETKKTGLDF